MGYLELHLKCSILCELKSLNYRLFNSVLLAVDSIAELYNSYSRMNCSISILEYRYKHLC